MYNRIKMNILEYIIGSSRIFKKLALFLLTILIIGIIFYMFFYRIPVEIFFSIGVFFLPFVILAKTPVWAIFFIIILGALAYSIAGFIFWTIVEVFLKNIRVMKIITTYK